MGRSARVVLLADVHGLRAPKRLAAAAVRALAEGPGLDAVLLEVPADEQPYLEAYMHQPEDDATVLLSRPRAIREDDPESREYLALYQAIRSTSDALGP